jgi:ankyrin repeat protein
MALLKSLWRSLEKMQIQPAHAGSTDIHEAVKTGDLRWLVELLEGGADVHMLDVQGAPPLQVAAALGHVEIARLLVEKGADVNFVSQKRGTPLMVAAACLQPEVIKLLICRDADLNKKGVAGRFPVFGPYRRSVIAVDLQVKCIRLLVANGARINERTDAGETALMRAAWFGNREAVKELLRLGADPLLRNARHATAMMQATERGHEELARMLKQHMG